VEQTSSELCVVTGAFGFTGRHIARRLLDLGKRVRTLTGHPSASNPFASSIEVAPLDFADPEELRRSLTGARVLFNTYWVRFAHGCVSFEQAIENSHILFRAARAAGVERIVHVSVTNPSEDSPLPYFRGKAQVERALRESGVSFAIVRPSVMFGTGDVLLNNIAWLLRHFPVFAIAGGGRYLLQPVHVEDVAELAVRASLETRDLTLDAVGPEILAFEKLVRLFAEATHSRSKIVHLSPAAVHAAVWVLGHLVGDVVLTRDELAGLMAGLLVSSAPPTARTRLSEWLCDNADSLGLRYASELQRHFAAQPSRIGHIARLAETR
jgi:uncharacterized protein YbjT (DUF2867 family)